MTFRTTSHKFMIVSMLLVFSVLGKLAGRLRSGTADCSPCRCCNDRGSVTADCSSCRGRNDRGSGCRACCCRPADVVTPSHRQDRLAAAQGHHVERSCRKALVD